MSQKRVIVVGAGLTGLAVAARLVSAGRDVSVLEGSARAGGQIHTFREPGLVVELGAEGFVARSRAVPDLCRLLGIEGALVPQLTTDTYAVEASGLVLLPPGEAARRLGFQVADEDLGRGIRSFEGGMGQLIDALARHVGAARIRFATPARAVARRAEQIGVELNDGTLELGSALVLATPARAAASLLGRELPAAAAELSAPSLLSNVSVNLLYRAKQLGQHPAGSGVIFPESFGKLGLRALSLVGHKFEGRVAVGQALVRVFFRPQGDALEGWSDERFAAEAAGAIAGVLHVQGEPERSWVSRWADALPVFTPEFRARVAAAESALAPQSVHLAGSAFHGAGIDAAVASAERVAARLLA